MPPSHSRVGKRLKFLVHIAMSSAYLIFICEASKHRDRGSHWEERMVEANEEKKREIKERENKHKVGRENLFFKSGLFTHSQWSQNVQRVQCIGSETKLEAHYSTFFCGKKKQNKSYPLIDCPSCIHMPTFFDASYAAYFCQIVYANIHGEYKVYQKPKVNFICN